MMPAARRVRKSRNIMFEKAKKVYRGIDDKIRLYYRNSPNLFARRRNNASYLYPFEGRK
jgi:hypothetical protein